MGSISLQDLEKSFGNVDVLKRISLDVAPGEFVALVGPSGCGKSTLLRVIAGLEEADEGAVLIDGRDVTDAAPRERDIAMVFQSYALYPDKTVRRNLEFSLRLRKATSADREARVRAASAMLGLDALLERFPKELSGGQRQRVAMGRAVVRDPAVFLFDEPLSNLDAKLRAQMRLEIKALHERLSSTAIYVTHDQVEAMTMADRIVVMNHGHIEQVGAPLELYDRPASRFVAEFIGSPAMNVLQGTVVSEGTGKTLMMEGGSLPLPDTLDLPDGTDVLCGIRPEHVVIGDGGVSCRIMTTEPLGREVMLYGDVAAANMDRSFCIAPGERRDARNGELVQFGADPANLHLFHPESGRRLDASPA